MAKRPCTTAEVIVNPKQKAKVLIEIIGSGKFIIVPPTPGYHFLQHDFNHLPKLNELDKGIIFSVASSFNQLKDTFSQPPTFYHRNMNAESPFDDYNLRGDVIGLLLKHGWKYVQRKGERTFFQRPGETDHATSGDYHHGMGLFTVFSSSTDFVPEKGYKPSAIYAILECNGDFKHAAKRLLSEGYGIAYKDRKYTS